MDWLAVIKEVGFPIFAFMIAGLACKYVYDHESAKGEKANERVDELTAAVNHNSEAVNHNTEAILRLIDKEDK